MATKPGNTTALIPQASRTWLPNQNGHHASPAINAHSSARSTMALLAASLFTLETPVIGVSMPSEPKIDAASATGRRRSKREPPNASGRFSSQYRREPIRARYRTSGEIAFYTRRGLLITTGQLYEKKW